MSTSTVNPDWAKLPIFERSKWQRVRFGDVVENLNEPERNPVTAGIEQFIGLEHLEPGSLHIRCSYLNPRLHQTSALTAQPSKPELSHYQCFLVELIDFILGDAGKPYKNPPPRYDKNWDRVIDDLTKVTAKRATKYMRRASAGALSTRGQYLFFLSGNFPKGSTLSPFGKLSLLKGNNDERNGPPEVSGKWGDGEGAEGGLSVIEFVASVEG